MNNFTSVHELSRRPENIQGQQNVFQASIDSKFKESPWRSTMSGNLSLSP